MSATLRGLPLFSGRAGSIPGGISAGFKGRSVWTKTKSVAINLGTPCDGVEGMCDVYIVGALVR